MPGGNFVEKIQKTDFQPLFPLQINEAKISKTRCHSVPIKPIKARKPKPTLTFGGTPITESAPCISPKFSKCTTKLLFKIQSIPDTILKIPECNGCHAGMKSGILKVWYRRSHRIVELVGRSHFEGILNFFGQRVCRVWIHFLQQNWFQLDKTS